MAIRKTSTAKFVEKLYLANPVKIGDTCHKIQHMPGTKTEAFSESLSICKIVLNKLMITQMVFRMLPRQF